MTAIEAQLREAAALQGLDWDAVIGPSRMADVVAFRRAAARHLYRTTRIPMPAIAAMLGRRGHTTVLHWLGRGGTINGCDRRTDGVNWDFYGPIYTAALTACGVGAQ